MNSHFLPMVGRLLFIFWSHKAIQFPSGCVFFNGDTQCNAIVLEKYIQKLFSYTGLVAELYVYLFIRKTLEMVVCKSSPGSGHVSEGSMESSLKLIKCATLKVILDRFWYSFSTQMNILYFCAIANQVVVYYYILIKFPGRYVC